MAPSIKNRQLPGDQSRDPSALDLLIYNERSGARKSMEVGRALLPLQNGANSWTTNASAAAIALPSAGKNLAIYNNSSTTYSVTVGDSTVTAQAVGAVQNSSGNIFVGVACQPNSWTYLSTGQWNYVITNNVALLVYLIDDPTYIVTQPANNAST